MFNPVKKQSQIISRHKHQRGMLMSELNTAIAIFALIILAAAAPLSLEQMAARRVTTRAVAMSVVDGEAEVLAAGAWRAYMPGEQDYPVSVEAVKSLPPGRFVLNVNDQVVRLEWRERKTDGREISIVSREFKH